MKVLVALACACSVALLVSLTNARASADAVDAVTRGAMAFHGGSAEVGQLYSQCLLSTVDNDISLMPDGTTYVITGDIKVMWLRDANAQVRPYLFFADDPTVRRLVGGVIARSAKDILVDPYANAFDREYRVAERKFEVDSLVYPMWLAWTYWKKTGDASVFTPEVKHAYSVALGVLEAERNHATSTYRHDGLAAGGKGAPVAYTGMVWTGFRPSDDAAQLGYNIPDNMLTAVALGDLADLAQNVWHDDAMAQAAIRVRVGIMHGIQAYGVADSQKYGRIYAYEVDGLGNAVLMDDANVPSLLSIPYIGYAPASDPLYRATRRFVLSSDNPYYYAGKRGVAGVGSSHTSPGWVWPMSLVMQAMTSTDDSEVDAVLSALGISDSGDHVLHESFDPNNPARYTRGDFGWPCSLYAEMIMERIMDDAPLPAVAPVKQIAQ